MNHQDAVQPCLGHRGMQVLITSWLKKKNWPKKWGGHGRPGHCGSIALVEQVFLLCPPLPQHEYTWLAVFSASYNSRLKSVCTDR